MPGTVKPTRRIKRGELYGPGRYWSLFMAGSFLVHALVLAPLSEAALSFVRSLKSKQEVSRPVLYVSLLYQPPVPLRAPSYAKRAVPSGPAPARRASGAKKVSAPSKAMSEEKTDPVYASPTAKRPDEAALGSVDKEQMAYAEHIEDGSVLLIRGTEKTVCRPEAPSRPAVKAAGAAPPAPAAFTLYTSGKPLDIERHATAGLPEADPMGNISSSRHILKDVTVYTRDGVKIDNVTAPEPAQLAKDGTRAAAYYETEQPHGSSAAPDIAGRTAPAPLPIPPGPAVALNGPGPQQTEKGHALLNPVSAKPAGPPEIQGPKVLTVEERARPVTAPPIVKITRPAGGSVSQSRVEIRGTVSGDGVGSVFLSVGKREKELLVKGGEFSSVAVLEEGDNVLEAAVADSGGRTSRDRVVVTYEPPREAVQSPKDLVVRAVYSGRHGPARLKCRFAPHPLSAKTGGRALPPGFDVADGKDVALVCVDEAVPGIYTIGVEYDTGPEGDTEAVFEVTLYGRDTSRKKARRVGPLKLIGKGYIPAVRVLLPECVFWEDDSWFSGVIEGGSGTLKYKEPEGIVWKEED